MPVPVQLRTSTRQAATLQNVPFADWARLLRNWTRARRTGRRMSSLCGRRQLRGRHGLCKPPLDGLPAHEPCCPEHLRSEQGPHRQGAGGTCRLPRERRWGGLRTHGAAKRHLRHGVAEPSTSRTAWPSVGHGVHSGGTCAGPCVGQTSLAGNPRHAELTCTCEL